MPDTGIPGPVNDPVSCPADDCAADDQPVDPAREGQAMLADIAVVLGVFLVAGLLAGVLWPQLVDPAVVTRDETGLASDEVALAKRFGTDGWFTVLAAVGGLVLGVVLMAWRRTHEVVTLLVVVAGALLASLVCSQLGHLLGPEDPNLVLADAAVGATAPEMVRVTADAAYLVWPISALIGALLVLWSPPGEQLVHHRGRRARRAD
jgi:hypothetical protein